MRKPPGLTELHMAEGLGEHGHVAAGLDRVGLHRIAGHDHPRAVQGGPAQHGCEVSQRIIDASSSISKVPGFSSTGCRDSRACLE